MQRVALRAIEQLRAARARRAGHGRCRNRPQKAFTSAVAEQREGNEAIGHFVRGCGSKLPPRPGDLLILA